MTVQMEFMRPRAIEEAMAKCPVLYVPLGTIEWHGRHNVAGLDAVKAHALCVRAAERGGGVVVPPVYGGIGGLPEPHTFVTEDENDLFSVHLRPWLERQCSEAVRQGFKAIIMLTGHYGAGQQMVVREAAVRMTKVLNIPVLGTPEYFLALDEQYYGDHAAFFETSLMMYLYPDTVDLSELGEPPHQGVGGKDPKEFANADDGKRMAEAIINRMATLAPQMCEWDTETINRFRLAEEALVNHQIVKAGHTGQAWAAWQNLSSGVFDRYPEMLTTGDFEGIIDTVTKL